MAVQFNSFQQGAIAHGDGPALVLAGPGSGKTAVITARIQTLIQKKIAPEHILVLTFTRAAAEEMKNRYRGGGGVTFGTFHSVFWHILKDSRHLTEESILKPWEKKQMIRRCLDRTATDEEVMEYAVLLGRYAIVDPETQKALAAGCHGLEELSRAYDRAKREREKLDYEDMASGCLEIFRNSPEILVHWQSVWTYILVDEFQDINASQYDVLQLLAGSRANLFVVGDDDQSIYGFRGADPGFMFRFTEDYPGAQTYLLPVNYRCGSEIVETAGRLIRNNKMRFEKELVSGSGRKGEVILVGRESGTEENRYLINTLKQNHKDTAILVRTRREMERLKNLLSSAGIPVRTDRSEDSWKQHVITRDVLAYLALAAGPLKRCDFIRVMNRPLRELDREGLNGEILTWPQLFACYPSCESVLRKMEHQLRVLATLTPQLALTYIRNAIRYEVTEEKVWEQIAACAEITEDLGLFRKMLADEEFDSESWNDGHGFRKGRETRVNSGQETMNSGSSSVLITTYHGAKGLEFDQVFLPGLYEGNVPNPMALEISQVEEERRMFYVALTRARKRVVLMAPHNSMGRVRELSRFVREAVSDKNEVSRKNT